MQSGEIRHRAVGVNTTEVIAGLCEIIDRQNVIIQAQAMDLAQHDALTRVEEIEATRRRYQEIMGHPPTGEV